MDQELKKRVWCKALSVEGYNNSAIRKDPCGAWIIYDEYGNRESDYGWEIDHAYPLALGGGDDIDNLRPMQWQNNVSKGDDYPTYWSAIASEKGENIEVIKRMRISESLQEKIKRLYEAD